MNKNYTHCTVVLDRSGSMYSCAPDMEGGLNSFVKEQQNGEGKYSLSFIRFDNEYEKVLDFTDIKLVGNLSLDPRGGTALNDAIGRAVVETGETLAKMKESDRPALVKVLIITDGGENASREYSSEMVKELITNQENKYNWQFTFLGANQDSFLTAQNYGINLNNTSNYNVAKSKNVWADYSKKSLGARSAVSKDESVSMAYSGSDRDALV